MLPEGKVDLVLMVDVYHECTDRETGLAGQRKALRPVGRLVLVEFRGEDSEVPIKPEHKMTLKQVRREVQPQGSCFQSSLEFPPWQHVIIFEKPCSRTKQPPQEAGMEAAARAQFRDPAGSDTELTIRSLEGAGLALGRTGTIDRLHAPHFEPSPFSSM